MSKTSRSAQFAAFQTGTSDGSTGSLSATGTFSRRRALRGTE